MSDIDTLRLSANTVWIIMLLVWIMSAFRTKRTVQRQRTTSQLPYIVILIVGATLIFAKLTGISWLDRPLFPVTTPLAALGLLGVLAGVTFTLWARYVLGRNWSNTVTLKQHHTLMRHGPYRISRHPIYSGIILGMCGSALQLGTVRCVIGVALMALSFWLKARIEERVMAQHFGDQYLDYRRETKMLIPFLF